MAKRKIFGVGLLTGVALTSLVFFGGMEVKKIMTPTDEFVQAKETIADVYNVPADEVTLYRYDLDSPIWGEVMDTQLLSDVNGVYPNFVYTAKVNETEEVLAVVLATSRKNLQDLTICGKQNCTIEYSDNRDNLYTALINVSEAVDVASVVSGIDAELSK